MANVLDGGSFREIWAREQQKVFEKIDVYRAISNSRFEEELKMGDTVNFSHRSLLGAKDYTRGTDVTLQTLTNVNEQLVVNVSKNIPFYIDDLDALQSSYDNLKNYAKDTAKDLSNWIDGDVLAEYDQATSSIDDADINPSTGTANDGFTITTSNLLSMFSIAKKKLKQQNHFDNLFAVISPSTEQLLLEYLAGKESQLGDSTGRNGNIGRFYGFDLFVSNSTGWSATLLFGTEPTANDTVTVNGVAFKFVASPTDAGDIDLSGSAATTLDDLVDIINEAGTPGSGTYTDVTAANRLLLDGITATDGTTDMTLKSEGRAFIAVSETLTASADVWTGALQIEHQLFGEKGSIHIVVQKAAGFKVVPDPDRLGTNVHNWILYGLKTFNNHKGGLVDVKVRSDTF